MYAVVVVTEENRSANKILQANCEMTPEQGSAWLLVSFVLVRGAGATLLFGDRNGLASIRNLPWS
jgi:hypothetical protein